MGLKGSKGFSSRRGLKELMGLKRPTGFKGTGVFIGRLRGLRVPRG